MMNLSTPETQPTPANPEVREFLGYAIEAGSANKPHYPHGGYDRMVARNDLGLFAVADGAGIRRTDEDGRFHVPDIAAEAALRSIVGLVEDQDNLSFETVEEAEDFGHTLMSTARWGVSVDVNKDEIGETTLALTLLVDVANKAHWIVANAGDSSIKEVDSHMPGFPRLTDLVEEQCLPHKRNVIYNCITSGNIDGSQDEIHVLPVQGNTSIILATDGVTGDKDSERLTDDQYVHVTEHSAQGAADDLLFLSSGFGKKRDDKSVIVVKVADAQKHQERKTGRTKEILRAQKHKAAGFIAGLGVAAQSLRGKAPNISDKAKNASSRLTNGSLNALAWTTVQGDKLVAKARSGETYSNLGGRVSKVFGQTQDSLVKLHASASHGISRRVEKHREKIANLSEEEQARRRKINGRVIGVAVVALAAGVATWKIMQLGGASGGGHPGLLDTLIQDQPDSKGDGLKHQGGGHHHNHHGHLTPDHSGHHHNTHSEKQHVPRRLELDEKGSSIWSTIDETAEKRGVNLSDSQTYDLVSKTLHYNDLTWDDARHLPQGYDFRMPEEVRRIIEEESTKKKVH